MTYLNPRHAVLALIGVLFLIFSVSVFAGDCGTADQCLAEANAARTKAMRGHCTIIAEKKLDDYSQGNYTTKDSEDWFLNEYGYTHDILCIQKDPFGNGGQ